jgi:hypothetical protein
MNQTRSRPPRARADFASRARTAWQAGDAAAIAPEELREVLTWAVKTYAAQLESGTPAYAPLDDTLVTPTEVVVAASEMVRAGNLNLFDLAMWYRRPTATEAAMLGAR